MINTAGAYILILIYSNYSMGGIATHEMPSFEACKAAVTQVMPIHGVHGYCVAKEIVEDD